MKVSLALLVILAFAASTFAQYNYGEVLGKSLLFYEAQRSGHLPSNNRIPWRGDSMLNDRGDNGLDLTGGYFDAGDHVKFGFPMAGFTTVLAWGLLDYAGGYKNAGEYENGLAAIKWSTDYFIKAHPSPNEFYGQVGDGDEDHAYWGRPEDFPGSRPAFKIHQGAPGSDLAGETAAALAASSLVFRAAGDVGYADLCLRHAEELYNFAAQFRGKYSDSIPQAANFYNSWSGFGDELAWAAAWLYRATGNDNYLYWARIHYDEFGIEWKNQFGWDDKSAGVSVVLAKTTNEPRFKEAAQRFCDYILYSAPKTPRGLVYIDQWGALRHAANAAFVCMQAGDLGINKDAYYTFARQQINYILGDTGRSFVIGYGNNPPQRPHHRSSSCPNRPAPCDWNDFNNPGPNPQTLVGALVGGPDQNDNYADNRDDYVKNEVTTDYNGGFSGALAGLNQS